MAALTLYCFGALRAEDPQGRVLFFHGRKTVALLAYLAVERGQPHSRQALAGLLWPELPEPDARNNLRVALARLSAVLADGAVQGTRHSVQLGPGLQLELDTARFEQLIAETLRHTHPHRFGCAECHPKLIRAVELYRGDFLQGFYLEGCPEFEEWQLVQRERYHLQALEALADLTSFYQNSGDYALAERLARQQITLEPLREEGHRTLMRLLYYQHQRSAALNQFQTCRQLLQQELGLEPEEETLVLYQQIEAGSLPMAGAVKQQPKPSRHNLPAQLTPFIGREAELAELSARLRLREYRLLSVIGPGGMGKTRLALELAAQHLDDFSQGVFLISLAGVQTAQDIPAAIAQGLGIPLSPQPSVAAQLLGVLKNQELLLLLDNFEHLLEGVDFLLEVLQQAPRVVLLVTSREHLKVQAEDLYTLQGLPLPDVADLAGASRYASVRLFVDRARRVDKTFSLEASQLAQVVRICHLVEGLPLALELAASWVQEYTCGEIAEALKGSLDFLRTELRDVAVQHRSMRAVFERSWAMLSEAQQAALMQLSVFRGGFLPQAAQEVAGAAPALLTHLRYKTLVGLQGGRYGLHELLRQFAQDKLEQHPPTGAQTRFRHAQHYLGFLREHSDGITQLSKSGLQAIRQELDNIRQAWAWAVETRHLDSLENSLVGLAHFYTNSGLYEEGEQVYDQAARQLTAGSSAQDAAQFARVRIRLLGEHIDFLNSKDSTEQVIGLAREVIGVAESLGDIQSAARAYFQWGRQAINQGDNQTALPLFERGLGLAQHSEDKALQGLLLRFIANVWRQRGDYTRFTDKLLEILAIQHELGNRGEEQTLLAQLGFYGLKQHRYRQSRAYLEQAQQLSHELGDPFREYNSLQCLAHADALLGDYAVARQRLELAQRGFRELSIKWHLVLALAELSRVCARLGDLEAALSYGQEAVSKAKTHGFGELKCVVLRKLAYSLMLLGRLKEGEEVLQEALAGWQTIGNESAAAEVQANLIELWLKIGQPELAQPYVGPTLEHVLTHGFDGIDEPARVGLALYKALQARHDPKAQAILQHTLSFIRDRADEISEAHAQHLYLHGLSENQEIIGLGSVQL